MSKILVVDDEAKIREMIRKYAQYEGYQVSEAEDGLVAVEKCANENFDLIVMDVMMPNLDGFSACKEIKKMKDIPVILLTALGEEYDKIHGFDLGIDDYVVKPFSPKELMMRIQAVLKRTKSNLDNADVFTVDGLTVDFTARQVTINQEKVQLSPKEFDLLEYFIRNRGIALTREKLLQHVWGYDFFGDDRTLDTHIKLLRRNLQEYSKYIITLRGVGYRFEKDN
ncbi:response regulator transcription factor [Anaerorhabdus sp.]|jgi:two-component system, OmpR family, response regulator ResD|uniref:response regulator transcription factor n=1 Tax=Anaerorhabdus sp. TaxID=1872524 RepID=UPI002B212551|nr:response regulator transcription factor [Anaerorhabdus sp.]MEA4873854.1 response regulator transcription factor [Anaerorhabdus sp.]